MHYCLSEGGDVLGYLWVLRRGGLKGGLTAWLYTRLQPPLIASKPGVDANVDNSTAFPTAYRMFFVPAASAVSFAS